MHGDSHWIDGGLIIRKCNVNVKSLLKGLKQLEGSRDNNTGESTV